MPIRTYTITFHSGSESLLDSKVIFTVIMGPDAIDQVDLQVLFMVLYAAAAGLL